MISNYLKLAFRNLLRSKTSSFINIVGLATGLACCILIFLYVKDELSFDRFHQHGRSIFRINSSRTMPTGKVRTTGITPPGLAPALKEAFPEIVQAVRFFSFSSLVKHGEKVFEEQIDFVDPELFEAFSFPLLAGNPASALRDPSAIVLSQEIAEKYFSQEDPMGKRLSLTINGRNTEFTVTGVARHIPGNSSIQFDFLLPYERLRDLIDERFVTAWDAFAVTTYVQLREESSPETLNRKLIALSKEHYSQAAPPPSFALQPLTDIHLDASIVVPGSSVPIRGWTSSYILTALGIFILAIACINFVNLSLAQSNSRGKEIGIRKVLGANKIRLMRQFMGEAMFSALIALGFGVALAEMLLPAFNTLVGKQLALFSPSDWRTYAGLLALMILVGVLAGSYPAVFLSRFESIAVLTNKLRLSGPGMFSRLLIFIQFVLCIFLIVGTLVTARQVEYLRTMPLGFDKNHVIVIPTSSATLVEQYRRELMKYPAVVSVSGSGYSVSGRGTFMRTPAKVGETSLVTSQYRVDYEYLPTLGIELKEGRNFSRNLTSDATEAAIVNETFVKSFGINPALGTKFTLIRRSATGTPESVNFSIIGVVKDFHFRSLREELAPLVLHLSPNDRIETISVRVKPENISATLAILKETWMKIALDLPFNYSFLDEEVDRQYRFEERWGAIARYSSCFAIAIACFGLYSLTAIAASRRTKEIGVRRVLGASVSGIVRLLSGEFIKLIAVANALAWPGSYYVMKGFLQSYPYRISIGIEIFVTAGLASVLIAMATLSYRAIKAALANPVEALRYE